LLQRHDFMFYDFIFKSVILQGGQISPCDSVHFLELIYSYTNENKRKYYELSENIFLTMDLLSMFKKINFNGLNIWDLSFLIISLF
jgi:hypothetical protein